MVVRDLAVAVVAWAVLSGAALAAGYGLGICIGMASNRA